MGKQIRRARLAKQLSQQDLATIMGVTRQCVSQWEHNVSTPRSWMLPQLAQALGITIETLYK